MKGFGVLGMGMEGERGRKINNKGDEEEKRERRRSRVGGKPGEGA